MTKVNLKNILTAVRDMINRSRIAYKDYLGEETVTETKVLVGGTLSEQGPLTLKDPSFTGFVVGEGYEVTIDGTTQTLTAISNNGVEGITNVINFENPGENYFVVIVNPKKGQPIGFASGTYIGKTISISQTKTTTTKKYDIKKVPQELIPDTIARSADVAKVKTKADNAFNKADNAWTAADNAWTAAENAQTMANDAKTAAENAQATANDAQTTANDAQTTANNAKTAADNAVKYTTSQDLTDAQKQQARANIGAGTSSFSGSYNDLTDKPTAVQSDWEVNNDSNVAYIKNRTHYDRTEYSRILFSKSPIAGSPISDIYYYGEKTGSSLSIDKGNIYKVHGNDGSTYISTCQRVPIPGLVTGHAGYVLGNARLGVDAGYLNGTHPDYPITDTGEPWCFISYHNTAKNAIISTISGFQISSIYVQTAHELKQLDEKYIPSTIQRVGDDLILFSSTPDSTKQFKITVDDSGIITATEVI